MPRDMMNTLITTGEIVQSTPQDFFDKLNNIFRFTLDVCALPENAKCEKYYTPEDDGLLQPWGGGGGYGATLPMGKRLSNGSGRLRKNISSRTTTSSSCCFRQERTQGGFRTMYMVRLLCSSLTEDLDLGHRSRMLHSQSLLPST